MGFYARQTLCKYEDMASKVQGHHNSISEQLLGEMERHQREIAKLEADLERERRARMEAQAVIIPHAPSWPSLSYNVH
jgi:hypothetical protein